MRLALPIALAVSLAGGTLATAQTPAPDGATVAEVRTWLTGLGGQVSEPETVGDAQVIRIADQPLPWSLSFFNCQQVCDDLQFGAVFTGPIDAARVEAWNREMRYLKAVWIAPATPGGEATVVVQYDLLLTERGAEQLQEPTFAWLQLLRAFATHLTGPAAAPPTPDQ